VAHLYEQTSGKHSRMQAACSSAHWQIRAVWVSQLGLNFMYGGYVWSKAIAA
jgi:L-asparaginase II